MDIITGIMCRHYPIAAISDGMVEFQGNAQRQRKQ